MKVTMPQLKKKLPDFEKLGLSEQVYLLAY